MRSQISANSDEQTRQTNMTLMQLKRRKQLEEQLENKMQLLSQYTNTRGIGMRGSTVPQRDIDLLNNQIADLRAGIAELAGNPSSASVQQQARNAQMLLQQQARHQVQPSQHMNMQQQQQQQMMQMQLQPNSFGAQQQQQSLRQVSGINNSNNNVFNQQQMQANDGVAKSKRDQIWEQKFAQWKSNNMSQARGGGNGHFQSGGQIISGCGMPALDAENQPLPWLPSNAAAGGAAPNHAAVQQPMMQQQQPQQQQQQPAQFNDSMNAPRFGRRGSAPSNNSEARQSVPMAAAPSPSMQFQQQQQQMQQQQLPPAMSSNRRNPNQRSTALW